MNLQHRLDRIRQGFEKQALPEAVAIMHRVKDDLRNSGVTDFALKERQTAPQFELENSHGSSVSLSGLLEREAGCDDFFQWCSTRMWIPTTRGAGSSE
jgi:hypothetical protein